jgi:hypothetical protein
VSRQGGQCAETKEESPGRWLTKTLRMLGPKAVISVVSIYVQARLEPCSTERLAAAARPVSLA